jgi:16S rRNA (uracil1498-N3)-methyltransferase
MGMGMSKGHRFRFLAHPDVKAASNRRWTITGDEHLHLRKVLRLAAGAVVEVTDGVGMWAVGTLTAAESQKVVVETPESFVENPPCVAINLAFGALKPGSVDEILPALTELGVMTIHIFGQQETGKARIADKVIERWQRILLQSIKQCKRAWLPTLQVHKNVSQLLQATSEMNARRFVLVPGAAKTLLEATRDGSLQSGAAGELADVPASASKILGVIAVIGGEIGLAPPEQAALVAAGFTPVSLGPFILRAATAAVAASGVLAVRYGDKAL